MNELIDTHCHIDVAEFDGDRARVIESARARGVTRMVVPAIRAGDWGHLLDVCANNAGLYPALGLHPVYLDEHQAADLDALEQALGQSKSIVAVGEIGLDYALQTLDRQRQQSLFEAQLAIAASARLPVIVHARKSHDDVLGALQRFDLPGGIIHAFSGGIEHARRYIALGYKLGFGGMLTFERSTKLRALARALPLDAIVLETDAPDLTVAAHRGERNSPEYLPDVCAALAAVRDLDPGRVAAETTANACSLLPSVCPSRPDTSVLH